ncbi:hypothetical protein COSHB9_13240 [Companilactobacillus alimentarius]|nr:hypothetical protein [Companilactobacillus alimentarius]GEO45204.1 hypothetical protein LAL01_14360 [Companilactobacillus alimentarius]
MARVRDGWSDRRIAHELRSPSMISRELRRGTVCQIGPNKKPCTKYFADTAQLIYEKTELIHAQLVGLSKLLNSFVN